MNTTVAKRPTSATDTMRRAARYTFRDQTRRAKVQPLDRVHSCGKAIAEVVMFATGPAGAVVKGVSSCASVHSCEVCSPKIRQSRAVELADAIERWRATGGEAFFVTLTMQHHAGHSLADTVGALIDAWKRLTSGGSRRSLDRFFGSIEMGVTDRDGITHPAMGLVRAVDVTDGVKGWHPHYHVVLFTRRGITRRMVRDELLTRWIDACTLAGRSCTMAALDVQPIRDHKGTTSSTLAMYALKAGYEMMRHDLKRAGDGMAPFGLLDFAVRGHDWSRLRWAEYSRTMHGKRASVWSRNLREWYGEPDLSDEERLDESIGARDELGVTARDYALLRRVPGAVARCLKVLDADGPYGLMYELHRMGVPYALRGPDDPPKRPPGLPRVLALAVQR